jgi:hypothetical protein
MQAHRLRGQYQRLCGLIRRSLTTALCAYPVLALANAEAERKVTFGVASTIGGLVALVLWYLAVRLCRKGGGWILLGVLLAGFVALPVTGYALAGLGLFYFFQP